MKRILQLGAALLSLGTALPASAALEADAVLVYGSSWRRVLPTYAAAAEAPGKRSKAAADLPPVILWNEGEERWTEELLRRLAPKNVVVIGPPGSRSVELEIPGKVQRIEADDATIDSALAKAAWGPKAKAPVVYVADGIDLGAGMAASLLASTDRAPLLVADGDLAAAATEAGALARRLGAAEVVVVGGGDAAALAAAAGRKLRVLSRDEALAAYGERVKASRHLVVTAPADAEGPFQPPKLSLASIPYALGKGAPLAFVGKGVGAGRSPEQAVQALEQAGSGPYEAVSIVGDYLAIPMAEIADIDQVARGVTNPRIHKVPPFNDPMGGPADRASGRLAALDVYDLSRWVSRLVHGAEIKSDGDGALILANADHKFILGETISRTTASELKNVGVKTEAFYRDEIDRELIRKELPGHGLVLWEGHPRDLTLDDDALPAPASSLPPAAFFLQGCYTLDRADPYLLIERGANAVLGSYMAVYSASGSGFARAWVNAQLHDGETMGEALVTARNYLLATVELKKRRGHKDWRKTLRAALSWELWGDPTAPLPVDRGSTRKAPVQATVRGDKVQVRVPAAMLPKASASQYWAKTRPGALLSGLYDEKPPEGGRRLIELFLVEVEVPEAFGDAPRLSSKYDPSTYAWVFSPHSRRMWVLIHENTLPKPGKPGRLRFTLEKGEPTKG
ncbi:hypothetical protein [Vulgatibacter sp.]|uniref:hypothetical protein n=1 Tax=Vulgatibacter sp. TaxID=1971226 RepID=UPI003567EEFD